MAISSKSIYEALSYTTPRHARSVLRLLLHITGFHVGFVAILSIDMYQNHSCVCFPHLVGEDIMDWHLSIKLLYKREAI